MKSRIATFLMALCMFCAGTASAINPVNQNSVASKTVATLLKQELKYPKFAKDDNFQCCVLVRFIVDTDGSFKVNCVNCTNTTMKYHVKQAIEKIGKKELQKYAGQEFSFRLDFKLI